MRPSGLILMIALLICGGSVVTAQAPASPQTAPQTPPAPLPPVQGFEIVRAYPHDPAAFTQGLVWHDGHLFESTGRVPSSVRKVRLEDGVVLERHELVAQYFGEGLTELGGRLYSLTWTSGVGFVWDPDDLSEPTARFAYEGEGWGLTDDGSRLILSDGTPVIRFFDPTTFAETGRITVTFGGRPVPRINELEWIDGQIVANLWQQDLLISIDPTDGKVVGVVDLTEILPTAERAAPADDVLNGIAWDEASQRLFVTGKNWPRLFEIRLTAPEPAAPPAN